MLLNKICYSYCKCNFTGCLRSVHEFFDALPLGDADSNMIDEELNRKHTVYLFVFLETRHKAMVGFFILGGLNNRSSKGEDRENLLRLLFMNW